MIGGEGGKEFRGVRINAVLESEKDSARACVCMRVAKRKWQILARLGRGSITKTMRSTNPIVKNKTWRVNRESKRKTNPM